jgi:hypothetical protein
LGRSTNFHAYRSHLFLLRCTDKSMIHVSKLAAHKIWTNFRVSLCWNCTKNQFRLRLRKIHRHKRSSLLTWLKIFTSVAVNKLRMYLLTVGIDFIKFHQLFQAVKSRYMHSQATAIIMRRNPALKI